MIKKKNENKKIKTKQGKSPFAMRGIIFRDKHLQLFESKPSQSLRIGSKLAEKRPAHVEGQKALRFFWIWCEIV